jgi:pyruvate formate lyase activating enzyme
VTREGEKRCAICGRKVEVLSRVLPVCVGCLRSGKDETLPFLEKAHRRSRKPFQLPQVPPRSKGGVVCDVCVNQCEIPEGAKGYCGLRRNQAGKLSGPSEGGGRLRWYHDPLPTNCVADWVCPAGTGAGFPRFASRSGPEYGFKNLAVFYHGCSFDCLFCQNWTHREGLEGGGEVSPTQLAEAVDPYTRCICYFGGDPTPQLPHALQTSIVALKKARASRTILRICWETNGSMNPSLLDRMLDLSLESGGCVKFDLKAWNDDLHRALCGVSNRRTLENFERASRSISKRPDPPLLVASTLLVPGYIDEEEIRQISRWIASLHRDIPYALLAFYPQFCFDDLPVTSRTFAFRCKEVAEEEGLRRVRIGNMHVLS